MNKSLPERPDLEQLKKQAKDLLAAIRNARPEALARAKLETPEAADAFALTDAQRVLAREYAFPSWAKLKLHVETRDVENATEALLMAAVRGQEADVAEILREYPTLGRVNIFTAAVLGDAEGVSEQLARDPALATARSTKLQWTPLIFACAGRVRGGDAARAECARRLLAAGASANEYWTDSSWPDAKLPALYAATGINNYPQTARVLLAAGAKPNDSESIYHAAEHAHLACLEVLREFRANFSDSMVPGGNTPLYFLFEVIGLRPERETGVRWLLEHGANPNVVCRDIKETALHAAVRRDYSVEIVELLLQHGADPAQPRADGRTPLALAVRGGHEALAAVLRAHGATDDLSPVDRFLGACLRADAATARAMLAAQPGLMEALTKDDRAMVFEAAREDRAGALTLMGELGFDLQLTGEGGETPLHMAGWNGNVAAMRALIAVGVDVNRREQRFGAPPMGWVAHGSLHHRNPKGDYPACAEALIGAGATVSADIVGSDEVMAVIRRLARRK